MEMDGPHFTKTINKYYTTCHNVEPTWKKGKEVDPAMLKEGM